MITTSAMKVGFSGGVVVDYPNSSKAKKMYLVIDAGGNVNQDIVMTEGLTEEAEEDGEEEKRVEYISKKSKGIKKQKNDKLTKKSRAWILHKKEHQRK